MTYKLEATKKYIANVGVEEDIAPYLESIFSSFKKEEEDKEEFVNRILKETILSVYGRKVLEEERQKKQVELEQTQKSLASDMKELL